MIALILGVALSMEAAMPSLQETALPDFDALWNYGDPAGTEAKFRALLAETKTASPSWTLQLQTQIARTLGLQRKFDEAHKVLDEVEAALKEGDPVVRVRYLLERGRVFNSSKQKDKARPLFVEAWKVAAGAKEDGHAVDAAHMMGIIEEPPEALEWNEKAIGIAERSTQPKARKWLGSLYNNVGWTYHDAEKYDKALAMFERALKWREEQKQDKEIRIARWCIARTLRSLRRVEEALKLQQEILAAWDAAKEKDGFVYEEIAECLLALNRGAEAKPWFARAYDELSKDAWLAEKEPKRIERLKSLSQ